MLERALHLDLQLLLSWKSGPRSSLVVLVGLRLLVLLRERVALNVQCPLLLNI